MHTWSRRENGKHALNVLFVSIEVIKDWQLEVMLLLNPTSKGTGSWLVGSGVTAVTELAVVEADPDMVDVELVNVELVKIELVVVGLVAFFSLRGRRSPVVSCSAASLSGVQAGSARSGPKPARSDPDSQNSEPSSWVSTICSSIYTVADENDRQHVRNIRKRRWVVWIGR